MADLFSSEKPSDGDAFRDLCVVYIMYFDEARGHVPLLIFPSEKLRENKKYMRPIKYHSIWFLDIEQEEETLDHIDLEYKGYTFFGKKFLTKSKRMKRRAGLEEETPETIVIILSLPTDLDVFGDKLLLKLTNILRENYEDQLFEVIECEIAREAIIKTPKVRQCLDKGTKIKVLMRESIEKTTREFFSKALNKKTDSLSIKRQKAISYLSFKGIDFSYLGEKENGDDFSSIQLFDPTESSNEPLTNRSTLSITNINLIEDSQEIEIMVQNNTEREITHLLIKITHVKDFFEKEIMNQTVDSWFPEEELLFISPIIPHINEYLFFIIEETNDKEKLVSKKIDLNTLDKIKS